MGMDYEATLQAAAVQKTCKQIVGFELLEADFIRPFMDSDLCFLFYFYFFIFYWGGRGGDCETYCWGGRYWNSEGMKFF